MHAANLKIPHAALAQGARSLANTQLYVDELHGLAKKHNATILDIFSSWQKIPTWREQFINPDKLHLSGAVSDRGPMQRAWGRGVEWEQGLTLACSMPALGRGFSCASAWAGAAAEPQI